MRIQVCGIEGSFRDTCENVMRVMRENKESLMAVLEAFVHDPLLNWRLVSKPSPASTEKRHALTASTSGGALLFACLFVVAVLRGVRFAYLNRT